LSLLKAAADAQPRQRGRFQRAADDKGLARLGVDAHPDDEISIFFQKFVEVFHGKSFLPCKNGTVQFLLPSIPFFLHAVHCSKTKQTLHSERGDVS